jgi:hypothetical protein
VKRYEVYQCLEGEPMTDRDVMEAGSPFWNEGKWDNFVAPFLPDNCSGMTLVDMGCNAGLFLKLAEDLGFDRVIGVDSNEAAVERGKAWRDKNGGSYRIIKARIESCLEDLPMADYTVLANTHYYFTINDWLAYLDRLQYKTRYCIVVTAEKRHKNYCWASADVDDIRNYFRWWNEVGFIDELPLVGGNPRRLWGLCFRSPHIEASQINSLKATCDWQDSFYSELDAGVDFKETSFYRQMREYRRRWSEARLDAWFRERMRVYADLKENGQKVPILIDSRGLILDGRHRHSMMKNLGYWKVFTRRT